jgi:hypothetical protein
MDELQAARWPRRVLHGGRRFIGPARIFCAAGCAGAGPGAIAAWHGLAAALGAGRAFTAHLGRYPGGEIDMLVDGTVKMGAVSVSAKTSRQLAIHAANVPAGATVQLIAGPVDYAGQADPGTTVRQSFAPSSHWR